MIQSTDQEMIPATNAEHAHEQELVSNDDLLLPILKAFAQCTRSTRLMFSVRCMCRSHQQQSSSPRYSQQTPATRHTRPRHAWIISYTVVYYVLPAFNSKQVRKCSQRDTLRALPQLLLLGITFVSFSFNKD